MARLVLKFGGTSVADIERIRHVASIVKKEVDEGNEVAVVLSAMSGVTNQLVNYASELSSLITVESQAEYDVIVSTGEQVTVGLLSLCLQEMGVPARSWLSWQLPFRTDDTFSKARIETINAEPLLACMLNKQVVVVPGFQGINEDTGRVTTLGRGGSDTSAVALAAALHADRCDIYTDVDGVYTTDPRIAKKARKLHKIAYEEMLEMASLGAKVLQTRSVEMAMKHRVRLQVRSTFDEQPGTLLVEEDEVMERRLVTGIAYSKSDARITLENVSNTPGVASDVFGPLAENEINVDMIIQNENSKGDKTDMTFTVAKTDLDRAVAALEAKKADLKYENLIRDDNVAKISVVGVGLRSHAGMAQLMFKTLAEKGINIHVIATSEIKISVLIDEEYTELAIRALHTAYGLDGE